MSHGARVVYRFREVEGTEKTVWGHRARTVGFMHDWIDTLLLTIITNEGNCDGPLWGGGKQHYQPVGRRPPQDPERPPKNEECSGPAAATAAAATSNHHLKIFSPSTFFHHHRFSGSSFLSRPRRPRLKHAHCPKARCSPITLETPMFPCVVTVSVWAFIREGKDESSLRFSTHVPPRDLKESALTTIGLTLASRAQVTGMQKHLTWPLCAPALSTPAAFGP